MVVSSTGSPTPSSKPTWRSCTITSASDHGCRARMREPRTAGTIEGDYQMKGLISFTALAVALGCGSAQAQYSDGTIKIGVMNDMSGTYADLSGQGSVIAAPLAVEEFVASAQRMKDEMLAR